MTDVWCVGRTQTTASGSFYGVELFATEHAAREWAETHEWGPEERRTVQRKTVRGRQ